LCGDYKQSDYGKVILPFTVFRRLDCVLEQTRAAVLAEFDKRTKAGLNPEPFLLKASGQLFFNTSPLDMKKQMGDQDHIAENLFAYLQAFSPAVRDIFERFEFLRYVVAGKSMAWKNILDMRRAVDFLVSRPEVRADRLGCYGHSMGSTHTWLVGPWEPRLKCLVGNCCLPTYRAIHREHMLHCFPNFIPGIFPYGDTPDIAALTAPRALHLNLGELDGGSPIDEARRGCESIANACAAMHAERNFSYFIEPGAGHVLSEAKRQRTREVFTRHLRG